jgi:hypothetical protein
MVSFEENLHHRALKTEISAMMTQFKNYLRREKFEEKCFEIFKI